MVELDPKAAQELASKFVLYELDSSGLPHFLLKVPDVVKAATSDLGMEAAKQDEGSVKVSLLLYDIPTEPINYEIDLDPDTREDLGFLHAFIRNGQFRIHPCAKSDSGWQMGASETFRIPGDVLLKLKSFSLEWPKQETFEPEKPADEMMPTLQHSTPPSVKKPNTPDPRDTIIQKLKEQVHSLRSQLQVRDTRIIELEDELADIKSRGRAYRLSGERKSWWKPFSRE